LQRAEAITNEWRAKLGNKMQLYFVVPDYYESRPKRCANGWGSVFLTVTPDGTTLPCHTARMLPGLDFPNVTTMSVRDIWYRSEGFNRYRGTGWMKEPCASCPEKEIDLGGCRCQAYMLANDPAAADPVCDKSPCHATVAEAVDRAQRPQSPSVLKPIVFRGPKESRELDRPF
jgi:PqqA peptide cyclase